MKLYLSSVVAPVFCAAYYKFFILSFELLVNAKWFVDAGIAERGLVFLIIDDSDRFNSESDL